MKNEDILEVVEFLSGTLEAVVEQVESKKDSIKKALELFVEIGDSLQLAVLNKPDHFKNLAKAKGNFFKSLKAEGFTDDQALLLMVDHDLRVANLRKTLQSMGSSSSRKDGGK